MIRKLIYALRFMTCLPIPWNEKEDMVKVSRSSGMFPLVGLFIGLILFAVYTLSVLVFQSLTSAFLQTISWIIITGGLHLDGLADSVDGLGSRRERSRMLEIMKDSHIGAFGVLSLIIQILLKVIFLMELNAYDPLYVVLIPVAARWGQLISIRFYPSARPDGMGKFFKDHIRRNEMAFGLITLLLIIFILQRPLFLITVGLHGLYVIIMSSYITKVLGGLTGDIYGYICESGESLLLILTVIILVVF